jgi:cytochrome b involved in lipid metabolism
MRTETWTRLREGDATGRGVGIGRVASDAIASSPAVGAVTSVAIPPNTGSREETADSKRKPVTCDACRSCGDACGVFGCATCGGPRTSRRSPRASSLDPREREREGDLEMARTIPDGATAAAATEAAAAAAAAAANPRREGWGRDTRAFSVDVGNPFERVPLDADSAVKEKRRTRPFTCCEVMRRRANGQALLVARGHVYDATLFLADHPVGPSPLLRGLGRDNTVDMQMHSAAAQRAWHKLRIGVLTACPEKSFGIFAPPRKTFWTRDGGICAVS